VRRDYELALIVNPEVSEEEGRSTLERIEQIVATNGGQVVKVNQWGRRRMAYPIEKHRDGIYVFMDLILTPESVAEIDRTLKVSEIVLRHMVNRRDPKIVQKEREERAEREARAAAAAESKAAEAQAAAVKQQEEPAAAEAVAEVEAEAVAEAEEPSVLSEVEAEDVPPAIEESVEA